MNVGQLYSQGEVERDEVKEAIKKLKYGRLDALKENTRNGKIWRSNYILDAVGM